ncbi:hypothetical protein B0I37DRAFT_376452 [Chaetomium sp. MPI-CAGE-AT-0009]|nr:hypothetical protein B0I37DRAFT_376452 [Chaetomium sp. MPI-CAGE-AT-0009]
MRKYHKSSCIGLVYAAFRSYAVAQCLMILHNLPFGVDYLPRYQGSFPPPMGAKSGPPAIIVCSFVLLLLSNRLSHSFPCILSL